MSYDFAMLSTGKLTLQVRETAERISSSVSNVLGIALLAVVLAAGALLVSLRCLNAVRA